MLSSAASDVHPLLYYLAAKLFLDAVRLFAAPSPETCVVLLRLFSVLPMCVLSLLGYTRVRRYMGERCGLLFTLFVGFAPSTYYLGLQIRMYSWAALWVFCAFLFAWRLAAEQRQGSGAKSRFLWAGLAAFSLLAAYTHYYALTAAVFIQLGLLIFLLHAQRGSKASALVPWFLTVLGQLSLYLPGFFLFYRQASAVSDGYWIQIQYPDILEEIASFFVEGALPRSLALPTGILLLTAIFAGVAPSQGKHTVSGRYLFVSSASCRRVRCRSGNFPDSAPVHSPLSLSHERSVLAAACPASLVPPPTLASHSHGCLAFVPGPEKRSCPPCRHDLPGK